MTTKNENSKTVLKKVTEQAVKMSAIDEAVKKFQNLSKLTKDREFMKMKLDQLTNKLAEVEDTDQQLFDEDRGLRIELSEGYNNVVVKLSHRLVIIEFIKFISGQMEAKIAEIEDEIIKA